MFTHLCLDIFSLARKQLQRRQIRFEDGSQKDGIYKVWTAPQKLESFF
jgi:hypothetical protein